MLIPHTVCQLLNDDKMVLYDWYLYLINDLMRDYQNLTCSQLTSTFFELVISLLNLFDAIVIITKSLRNSLEYHKAWWKVWYNTTDQKVLSFYVGKKTDNLFIELYFLSMFVFILICKVIIASKFTMFMHLSSK